MVHAIASRPFIERGLVGFPLSYLTCGCGAVDHRAMATIAAVLDCIKRDAPETLSVWVDENLGDRFEMGYSVGYDDGVMDGTVL